MSHLHRLDDPLADLIHDPQRIGMSVAGKLWQVPQPDRKFIALRAEQINRLSRTQAVQLYRLLVPSG